MPDRPAINPRATVVGSEIYLSCSCGETSRHPVSDCDVWVEWGAYNVDCPGCGSSSMAWINENDPTMPFAFKVSLKG
jgi:hypothetical protein